MLAACHAALSLVFAAMDAHHRTDPCWHDMAASLSILWLRDLVTI